jgi:hypothetical protein
MTADKNDLHYPRGRWRRWHRRLTGINDDRWHEGRRGLRESVGLNGKLTPPGKQQIGVQVVTPSDCRNSAPRVLTADILESLLVSCEALGEKHAHAGGITRLKQAKKAPRSTETRLWIASVLVLLTAMIIPVLIVDVPPLTDYPSHLARAYVLAFHADDPILQQMYRVHWDIIPNLAIDLILPPLLHVFSPVVASTLFVALSILLPTTGAIALSIACFRRLSPWQLCAGFAAYNSMFLIGFLNFQMALGAALWGAAIWIFAAPSPLVLGLITGAFFGVLTFFFHLFGFLFFALLIGSFELAALYERGLRTMDWRQFATRASVLAAALMPPLVLYLFAPFSAAGGDTAWQTPIRKLYFLLSPLLSYSFPLSVATAAALGLCLIIWATRRQLELAPLCRLAIPLLLAIYVVLPVGSKGGFWIDTRIPVMLAFTLFSTTMPRAPGLIGAMLAGLVLSGLMAARLVLIGEMWLESREDISSVRHVMSSIEPGSRVLAVQPSPENLKPGGLPRHRSVASDLPATYEHYAAFALIDRRAFWADAFVNLAQQPVRATAFYLRSLGEITDFGKLRDFTSRRDTRDPDAYLNDWPDKFDFVLLLNADRAIDVDDLLPGRLVLLDRSGMAALYRVQH